MSKYCQHRAVSDDGRITCRKIMKGDQEVSLAMCEACPAAAASCGHLRFSLEKEGGSAVVIRYGNGRTEVLETGPAGVSFVKAACAALLRPIDTRADCAGCLLRTEGFARELIPATELPAMPGRARIIPFPHTGQP